MAGSFTSPSGATPKTRTGKPNRPRRSGEVGMSTKPEYPITDSMASDAIPPFATRRRNTNNKSGFNTKPARPPAGRLAECPSAPSRGSGKTL